MQDNIFPDTADETPQPTSDSRRTFIKQAGGILGFSLATPLTGRTRQLAPQTRVVEGMTTITLRLNGQAKALRAEPRVTLLDALREYLDLTGTKKGCDHGQCGACTVHVDGRRTLAYFTLAIAAQGKDW